MRNDKGAYFLLVIGDAATGITKDYTYDNAEAARKHAKLNEASNPNGTRTLFKMLPNTEPIQVMI